jgi:hypothetical protein
MSWGFGGARARASYAAAMAWVTVSSSVSNVARRPRGRSGAAPLIGLTTLSGLALLINAKSVHPSFTRQLVGMSIILTGYGLVAARLMSGYTPLSRSLASLKLGPWFGIGFAVVFGSMSLVWLQAIRPNPTIENRAIMKAGWIVLTGLALFTLGYMVMPKQLAFPYKPRRVLPMRGPGVAAVVTLWLLALASQGFSIGTGALGYLSGNATAAPSTSLPEVLALVRNLGFLASLLTGWHLAHRRTGGARFLSVSVVASQIGLSLFSGVKEPALTQLVAFFVGYASVRRVKTRWVLSSLAVFVVLVVPFVTLYRAQVATGGVALSPAQALAQVSFGSLAQETIQSSASQSWTQVAERLARIGDVAIIVQKTPGQVSYKDPIELIEAPALGIIPRSIWPGKPVLNSGAEMARIYYDSTVTTSAAVTPEGDLWKHGGATPLVVGMLALGVLIALIDKRLGDPRADPRIMFLPMLLLSVIVKEEADFVGLLAGLATTAILSALATGLVGLLSGGALSGTRGTRYAINDAGSPSSAPT